MVKFPCGGGGGGGGDSNCNESLSQPNVQKNSRALLRGRERPYNLKKIDAGKTIKSTPKNFLCTFSFTPIT